AAHEGDATFFPPSGGTVSGAREVATRYSGDVRSFAAGGRSKLEVLQRGASGELAFWTGFQDADVRFGGKEAHMKLRVTELFRRENGDWKLMHRHADMAAEEQRQKAA